MNDLSAPGGDAFLRRYLAHASTQLPGRGADALRAIAARHADLGGVRAPGGTLVRSYAVDGDVTALDVVTLDVPYLVDSVVAALQRAGHPVKHVLHPQLLVVRDDDGRLTDVLDIDDTDEAPPGATAEAWMHYEIDAVDADEQAGLETEIASVLTDVHLAVADSAGCYALIRGLADRIEADPGQFDRDTSVEAAALLRWLADGNYMILGHASYSANDLAMAAPGRADGNESGVLRGSATISARELLPAYRSGAPLVIFKSPLVSTVRRSARYDCVTVVAPEPDGSGDSIHVFLGLIIDDTDARVVSVPVIRRRIADILHRSGARANSHHGRQLLAALRTLPRDELLEAGPNDLLRLATLVVQRADSGGIGVFARTHLNNDFISVLVYLPADRLGPETVRRVRDVVLANWPGRIIGRDDRIVELGLARLHFLIALRPGVEVPNPDRAAVEATVARVTRRWSDDLSDLLLVAVGEAEAERIERRYRDSFPEAYKEDFAASVGVTDLRRLESLPDFDGLTFDVYTPGASDPADRRLKIYRTGSPLSLGRTLPMLERMGIEVLDERPYEFERTDGTAAWVYDFGLKLGDGVDFSPERSVAVIDTLRELWRGGIEQDGFNALVVRAGLTWQQVVILRAYTKYLRQAGTAFSEGYIEQTLNQHAGIARLLVDYFAARFDPDSDSATPAEQARLRARIDDALTEVTSLDQDRILRSLLGLAVATVRTNYYQRTADGGRPAAFAIKIDSRSVPELPEPRPKFEIWVYSPRVEGVHLRFGAVARGGLRWSDRREDFRTEVLGLVKAQTVKNVVIVPVGSKGGFVAKQLPDPAVDRDAWMAEGIACYSVFITSLLELTDNYRLEPAPDGGEPVQVVDRPASTRCYDDEDPYLVVAADKGTATFSDIANSIAVSRGFWLGDAFASGGSVGYDHKAMGITARGAWESVKYHFAELGVDTQNDDFTVVGIGDMSGDVFGNGMLLSEHIRLVAAFDHRHIFLDPAPDAAASFAERRRMFVLARSSWDDYDRAVLSTGGGVFSRMAKTVALSAEAAAVLGLGSSAVTLTPNAVIRAILQAPADLLFNGGIGTYVKSAAESHSDAGDKTNDAVRINGADLRVRVVGEGGNLGFTQRGRIEFARAGGRINTDAIDNSAGVDTSDHEVNIKILLDRAIQHGSLSPDERAPLLASVTDEVAQLVLADNYDQNVLLGVARFGAVDLVSVHRRLIRALEKTGELDRALEFLPTDRELVARETAGDGLTSPELSVLAAYVKIVLTEAIGDSSIPDEPFYRRMLGYYFPGSIAERFSTMLESHPLHREIVTTSVVNEMVNRAGITFAFRAREETSADVAQTTRAYAVARQVFGLGDLWTELDELDTGDLQLSRKAQVVGYREVRRLIDRAVRWLVDVRFPLTDVTAEVDRFRDTVATLAPEVAGMLRGDERDNLQAEVARLVSEGLPEQLAERISALLSAFLLLDVVEIAATRDRSPVEVAEIHYALSARLSVDDVLTAVTRLERDDRWSALARAAMRHDVYAALVAATSAVLDSTEPGRPADVRIAEWEQANAERVARVRSTLAEALELPEQNLATLSVVLRVMRSLAG